jgi:hypothetical protein
MVGGRSFPDLPVTVDETTGPLRVHIHPQTVCAEPNMEPNEHPETQCKPEGIRPESEHKGAKYKPSACPTDGSLFHQIGCNKLDWYTNVTLTNGPHRFRQGTIATWS